MMALNQKRRKRKESTEEREKQWNLNTRKRRKMISRVLFIFFSILALIIASFVIYIYTVA